MGRQISQAHHAFVDTLTSEMKKGRTRKQALMAAADAKCEKLGVGTSVDRAEFAAKHGDRGVSLKRDHRGVYVTTHRARSDSFPSAGEIPKEAVDFVESTG